MMRWDLPLHGFPINNDTKLSGKNLNYSEPLLFCLTTDLILLFIIL